MIYLHMFSRMCLLVDVNYQQMGCRWMHSKILDSMLLKQMFSWILLGSTTSLPSLERKLLSLHVHLNMRPCLLFVYCFDSFHTCKWHSGLSAFYFIFWLICFHTPLIINYIVQILVFLERYNTFLYVFKWASLQPVVFKSQIWWSLNKCKCLKMQRVVVS